MVPIRRGRGAASRAAGVNRRLPAPARPATRGADPARRTGLAGGRARRYARQHDRHGQQHLAARPGANSARSRPPRTGSPKRPTRTSGRPPPGRKYTRVMSPFTFGSCSRRSAHVEEQVRLVGVRRVGVAVAERHIAAVVGDGLDRERARGRLLAFGEPGEGRLPPARPIRTAHHQLVRAAATRPPSAICREGEIFGLLAQPRELCGGPGGDVEPGPRPLNPGNHGGRVRHPYQPHPTAPEDLASQLMTCAARLHHHQVADLTAPIPSRYAYPRRSDLECCGR
jgi:hypothetical protein